MQRAAHQILDRPLILDDPIAVRIVGRRAEAAIPGRWVGIRDFATSILVRCGRLFVP